MALLLVGVSCATGGPEEAPPSSATTIATTTTTPPTTTTAASVPDKETRVDVVVREGQVVSEYRVEVPLGNRVALHFDSDTRLLVHIHGYDHEFRVEIGDTSAYEFEGNLPGIFEVEDHLTHRALFELQVSP